MVAFLGAGAEAAGVVVGAGVGIDRIDAAQHLVQQEPVVVIEVPGEGLLQHGDLRPHSRPGHLGENLSPDPPPDRVRSVWGTGMAVESMSEETGRA